MSIYEISITDPKAILYALIQVNEGKETDVPYKSQESNCWSQGATRKKIVSLELETATLARDKMAAENFTAQLKRNLAIAEYNRELGKDIPLFPLTERLEEVKPK